MAENLSEATITHRQFAPVGRCIYCGSEDNKEDLTREHILPFSLGGRLVLPKSSCSRCAHITRDFEREITRKMLWILRLVCNFPTRKRRERPFELPLQVTVHGEEKTVVVPVSRYPAAPVRLPIYELPGLLRGVVPGSGFGPVKHVSVTPALADQNERFDKLAEQLGTKELKFNIPFSVLHKEFLQLLAKIAHSAAIAEFGFGSFEPMTIPIILGKDFTHCADLIGSLPGPEWKPVTDISTSIYRFSVTDLRYSFYDDAGALLRVESRCYLLAGIRLFQERSDPATPLYCVVVGIPSDALKRFLEEKSLPEARVSLQHKSLDPRVADFRS